MLITDEYIEDNNILNDYDKENIKNHIINNQNLNWFYQANSSSTKYPFVGHCLANRNLNNETEIYSDYYIYFWEIFKKFINKHKLIKNPVVMRGALNWSLPQSDLHCDPHVDHSGNFWNFILYLTKSSGDTILYDEVWTKGKPTVFLNEKYKTPKELKRFSPEPFKMIGFKGNRYHSFQFPKPSERRLIAVFTVKEENEIVY